MHPWPPSWISAWLWGHPYITSSQRGGGLPHWWRLMTRGRRVVGHDDVIKKEFLKTQSTVNSSTSETKNSTLSSKLLFSNFTNLHIIIIALFTVCFKSMLSVGRHSLIYLIDISGFTTVWGASRNREIEVTIFTDNVILGGWGLGAWWRLMTRGRGVENGLKIDDVIYGWPLYLGAIIVPHA